MAINRGRRAGGRAWLRVAGIVVVACGRCGRYAGHWDPWTLGGVVVVVVVVVVVTVQQQVPAIGGRGEKQATKRAESGLLVPTGQDATHQCTAHTGMHLPSPRCRDAAANHGIGRRSAALGLLDLNARWWWAGLCGGGICTTAISFAPTNGGDMSILVHNGHYTCSMQSSSGR